MFVVRAKMIVKLSAEVLREGACHKGSEPQPKHGQHCSRLHFHFLIQSGNNTHRSLNKVLRLGFRASPKSYTMVHRRPR